MDADQLALLPCARSFGMSLDDQCELHRLGIEGRFAELRERIPLLDRLAAEERIDTAARIEDIGPLLMPHSAYKSYPLSLLERGRFDQLTTWLNALTTVDLGSIDARGCDSIDDWIDFLDAETPLRVVHSTGTSGKLSFIPRSSVELKRQVLAYPRFFDKFRNEPQVMGGTPFEETYVLFPQYRKGAMTQHRLLDGFVEHVWKGDESHIVTLHPSRFSADVASIGGRLLAAQSRGSSERVQLPQKLAERRAAFIAEQERTSTHLDTLLETLATRLRGVKATIIAHPGMMLDLAAKATARGLSGVFAPESFAMIGGGTKGRVLPEGWQQTVKEFLGVSRLRTGYGMTEMTRTCDRDCPAGHYHLPLSTVPFIVDPITGAQRPRSGVHTGRFGLFDLLASSYWGGFLTGDEVTVNFGDLEPCGCGRIGAYLLPSIRRFSESEAGSDDKISCAGAPEAHDRAVDFIIRSSG